MTPRQTRTLVVHTGGIGDFLLALPAIAALREGAPLDLAGHRDRLALAVAAGIADAAHSLDAIDFQSALGEPSSRLRNFLSRFDRAIVLMRDPDGAIRRGFEACGIARVGTFPGLPDASWSRHATEYYADCLGVSAVANFRLAIQRQGPALDVVIHPGSGSPKKNWPLENFAEVAARHQRLARRVTWCLGPAEIERGTPPHLVGDTLHRDSLVDLAGRLATARLYIGNDCGITHIAAALGVPTIAIFGPTDPTVWAPRGVHVHAVRGDPWPKVADILSASAPSQQL
jgi:hypothetical protein